MEPARISFYDQIAVNKRKSYFLMFCIFAVFLILGYVISMAYDPGSFFFIMIIAIIFSISYLLISYYNCDKIALSSVQAKPADKNQFRQYYDLVEGLTLASGLPMPKLYIMQNEQINAFATGRDPGHAVVCVTTGALQKLNKSELEGVLSHEMSHIANYDIRFMTLTAVMVGMIAIISEIFLRSLWFRGSSNRDDNKGNAIFLIIGIVLAILAPIAVQLVQLAISRKREFTADATAVKFTRTPTGLIGALKKIKTDKPMKVSNAMSSLFMSDPKRSKMQNLFSTHPDIDTRIKILEKL
jgi:heat shock protein HtpX